MTISIPDTLTVDNAGKYIVSIRLWPDGLSFSGYEPSVSGSFFHRETEFDRTISLSAAVKDFFFAHEFLAWPYGRVHVICAFSPYTIIPDAYFLEEKKKELLDFNLSVPSAACLTDSLKEEKATLAFGVDVEVYEFLSRSLSSPHFTHAMVPLLDFWKKRSRLSRVGRMYAVIERKRMDIACFGAGGDLLFANTFRVGQLNDILYYILYVWKQVGLNPRIDELYLSVEPLLRRRIFEALKIYLSCTQLMEMPAEAYLLGTEVAKAPLDLISLLLCE